MRRWPRYEQALALDPKFAYAWKNKAGTLNALKHHTDALVACEQSLILDSKDAWVWQRKADALRGLGRMKEAKEAEARAKALGG